MTENIVYTDVVNVNINVTINRPADDAGDVARTSILSRVLGPFSFSDLMAQLREHGDDPDAGGGADAGADTPSANTNGVIDLEYAAIADLKAGDRVQWAGIKMQFTGALVEDAARGYDSDQSKDVIIVRVRRDDTGSVVKLNLASDHNGVLALI